MILHFGELMLSLIAEEDEENSRNYKLMKVGYNQKNLFGILISEILHGFQIPGASAMI